MVCVFLNFVVLSSFGSRKYVIRNGSAWYGVVTPQSTFQQMKFSNEVRDAKLNAAIGEMIEPHSSILYGKGSNIIESTKKYSQFFNDEDNKECRVLSTHNFVKFLIRYLPSEEKPNTGHYEMWNHTFTWEQCNARMLDYVVKSDRSLCKDNPEKILIIKGGGNRDETQTVGIDDSQIKWKHDERVISSNQKSRNNCVWLSTILLMQLNDRSIADRMIALLNEDNASYRWMFINKLPQSYKAENRSAPLLIQALRDAETGYTLKKINIADLGVNYIEYIFSNRTSGQYICQLEFSGGDTKHVIGVDTDRRIILDASESHAFELTIDNFNYCAGAKFRNVRKIVYCFELVKRSWMTV